MTGGFSLGLERTGGFETIAFCEIEPFCQKVLRKHWPEVPIFDDIRKLHAEDITESIDLICGGYPCQPFSVAGKRRGAEDDRHLWPEMFRLIQELRPTWVIGENVINHINMGLDQVLTDLEKKGYQARAFNIPACSVKADHKRERVWIVANSNKKRCLFGEKGKNCERAQSDKDWFGKKRKEQSWHSGNFGTNPDTNGKRFKKQHASAITDAERFNTRFPVEKWFPGCGVEPAVYRNADGIPNRVDRIEALGNSVMPQIPEIIGRAILQCEQSYENQNLSSAKK